jgi:3-hydroxyacyl-[acyl-carrier-protein] dehydratase
MVVELEEQFHVFPPLDSKAIKEILPHRYPFLLVDGITSFHENGVIGFKYLSNNEEVFNGHFPGEPVYPGVMIIETAAQVGACWILSRKENLGKIAYLMRVEEAKFRRPVGPGVKLVVDGLITNLKSRTGRFQTTVTVDDVVVANVKLMFAFQKGG